MGWGPTPCRAFTLTVNEAPSITSANSVHFTIGSASFFTVTTSGYPLPSIARGGVSLPGNVTFSDNGDGFTGTLSGTPMLGTVKSYALSFTVGNGVGNASPQNFTLTVDKAQASVNVTNLVQTYDGNPKFVNTTTNPAGLGVTILYGGSTTPPTNAGPYPITATINDLNYQGTNTLTTLNILKASATVFLNNLNQIYNGTPISVLASTNPVGLNVTLTYNGSATMPTNAGTYNVVGTVSDVNYAGSNAGQLIVSKANAKVNLSNLSQTFDGSPKSVGVSTIPQGLTVDVTYNGSPSVPNQIGTYSVQAAIDDTNYMGSATATFNITAPPQPIGTTASMTQPPNQSPSPTDQTVEFFATVTPVGGSSAISEGTVTFTVKDINGATVGSSVTSASVVGGNTSATYTIPGGTAVGIYSIAANYNGTALYAPNSDLTKRLVIGSGNGQKIDTTFLVNDATAQRSPAAQQIALKAIVTPVGGNSVINEGTVTFQIVDSTNANVGSPVTVNVVNGIANASGDNAYTLPAAIPLGTYDISASYSGTAAYLGKSGDGQLTITKIIGGLVPSVMITSIDRNPARTGVPVNITATPIISAGLPLSYTWNTYNNGQPVEPPLRVGTPAVGQPDILPTTFATEGTFVVGVIVDDGYNPDSGAAVTILVQRLAPNSAMGVNIANVQDGGSSADPNTRAAVQLALPGSLGGVVDVNISNPQPNGDFGCISGRTNCNQFPYLNTAFKFMATQIVVLQDMNASGKVLAQRMLAISQNEILADSQVTPPTTNGAMTVSNLKALFTFQPLPKKHPDTLTLKVAFALPGGLNFNDGSTDIYFGIGNVILKFNMQKGKAIPVAGLDYAHQSPVSTSKATLTLTGPPHTGTSKQGTPATASISLTSADLTTMGLAYLGITDPATSTAIPIECLMLVGGVPYRQVITATYTDSKGKGALIKK